MGVENPNLKDNEKKKYIRNSNFKELCLSFGRGYSKKEGEQSSAKMSLILHGALNNDQYDMNDIYYPDFDNMKDQDDNKSIDSKSIDNKSSESKLNNNFTEETLSGSEGELSEETESEYED
jgi:hypothetical protein